jgi:hypothetical protein
VAFLIRPSRLGTKKPRPTVARGTGRCTDLAIPDACEERRKREVVLRAESIGALGAESSRCTILHSRSVRRT